MRNYCIKSLHSKGFTYSLLSLHFYIILLHISFVQNSSHFSKNRKSALNIQRMGKKSLSQSIGGYFPSADHFSHCCWQQLSSHSFHPQCVYLVCACVCVSRGDGFHILCKYNRQIKECVKHTLSLAVLSHSLSIFFPFVHS